MKKTIYPLLSVCCVFVIALAFPRFASAQLSQDVEERHGDGAPFDSDCPSGMCGDRSGAQQNAAWPVSHSTKSEVVYVESEIFEEEPSDEAPVEVDPDAVVYEEENQPIEEPIIEEEPAPIEEVENAVQEPRSSVANYYMRLGVGLSIKDSDAEFRPVECGNGTSLACDTWTDEKQTFVTGSYGGSFTKEMGIGINVNSFLRFDAVIAERSDFSFDEDRTARGTTAHYDTSASDDPLNPLANDTLYDQEMNVKNTIRNLTVMGSLYLDFFRRYSRDEMGMLSRSAIAPYLGVGVGYAQNEISDMTGEYTSVYDDGLGTTHFLPGMWRLEGHQSSGLAWMLTGGIGFALSEKTWLDISYRYLNLGTIETARRYTIVMDTDLNDNGISGDLGDLDIDGDLVADPGYYENPNAGAQEFELNVHEVSIGLRYEF